MVTNEIWGQAAPITSRGEGVDDFWSHNFQRGQAEGKAMFTQHRRTWTQTVIRAVQAHGRKALAALTALATVAALVLIAAPAHAEETRIADPTTFTQWEQGIGDPTDPRSTGRVWTDKSVSTKPVTLKTYDGKDVTVTPEKGSFLVGLSAMSSAQQLIGVANVTKPLDIVLVLDTSGSMAWNMDGETNTYYPIYSSDPGYSESSDRYSILVDGAYQHIRYFPSPYGWGYYPNNVQDPTKPNYGWKTVVPKTSASDRDRNHVQFYEHGPIAEKDTRLHALKQAVHGFIDQTIADTGG